VAWIINSLLTIHGCRQGLSYQVPRSTCWADIASELKAKLDLPMSRDVNRLLHFEDSATNWCRRRQLYLCLRQHLNLYCVRNISWFEQPLNILIKRSPTLREFVIHLHLFGILTSKYHSVSCLSCHVIKLTRGLTELFLKIEELKFLFIYCRPSCSKRQVRKFRNWADYTQINEQQNTCQR
jgi:hypothetical protein